MLRDDLEYQRRQYCNDRDRLRAKLKQLQNRFDDYSDALTGLNNKIGQLEEGRSNAMTLIQNRMASLNPMSRFRTWYVEHVKEILGRLDSADGFNGLLEGAENLKSELRSLDEAIQQTERDCRWLDNEISRINYEIREIDMEAVDE